MTEAEAVKGLRKAAKQRERALDLRRKATDDLRAQIVAAQAAGVSVSVLAIVNSTFRCWFGAVEFIQTQPKFKHLGSQVVL